MAALGIASTVFATKSLAATERLEPSALGILSQQELIVLDARRGIFRVAGPGRAVRLGPTAGAFSYFDLAVGMVGGRESIFATLSVGRGPMIRLLWLDSSGNIVKTWDLLKLGGAFTGLALDTQRQHLYLANSKTCEIHRVDLSKPRSTPVWFATIRKAEALGPLAVDERRNRLLAGDPIGGNLHSVDLQTRETQVFAENLGEIGALAIDPASHRLYISDAAGERIWVSYLDAVGSAMQIFTQQGLEEPLGLAVAQDGTLWVGDHDEKVLLRYARTGTRLGGTLRPSF